MEIPNLDSRKRRRSESKYSSTWKIPVSHAKQKCSSRKIQAKIQKVNYLFMKIRFQEIIQCAVFVPFSYECAQVKLTPFNAFQFSSVKFLPGETVAVFRWRRAIFRNGGRVSASYGQSVHDPMSGSHSSATVIIHKNPTAFLTHTPRRNFVTEHHANFT